ncbi:hypothetical protein Ciccas_012414 [Cichlidogyrus casuarinus]|uniref:Phosphoprotein n=1 Tax=Cichlidogyrus casuarinus TaxID=1844966 RepID=A0ABD2PPN4_9PLAT
MEKHGFNIPSEPDTVETFALRKIEQSSPAFGMKPIKLQEAIKLLSDLDNPSNQEAPTTDGQLQLPLISRSGKPKVHCLTPISLDKFKKIESSRNANKKLPSSEDSIYRLLERSSFPKNADIKIENSKLRHISIGYKPDGVRRDPVILDTQFVVADKDAPINATTEDEAFTTRLGLAPNKPKIEVISAPAEEETIRPNTVEADEAKSRELSKYECVPQNSFVRAITTPKPDITISETFTEDEHFLIEAGRVQKSSAEFLRFHDQYINEWSTINDLLKRLEGLLETYSVPFATVRGKK